MKWAGSLLSAFFFALVITVPASADASSAGVPDLSDSPEWRALLHFTGSTSSASGESFFVSPNGARDPSAEFTANFVYFKKNPDEARCRFPARALFFERQLGFKFPAKNCERYETWKSLLAPKGLELVFAAAFINSPSSMYGHTLLKFPRAGKTEGNDLLDYTLNYGAETGNVVGLPYVWKGLTGGFTGYFATAPFYLKVKEYNFVENRDFWIYPLKLTSDELEILVAHTWELREVPFDYYFLKKNCAYFLLEFLEVAWPGKKLAANFGGWTVPMDTIRVLQAEGKIGTPMFRPSRYKTLRESRDRLSGEERDRVRDFLEKDAAVDLSAWSTPMLDAAYEYLRYREEKKARFGDKEKLLLTERARRREPAPVYDFSRERSPDQGHSTGRVSVAGGTNTKRTFGEITYRGTLHDLLSDPLGYEDFSELTMGDLRVRFDKRVYVERFEVMKLRALAPTEEWVPKNAWTFKGGFSSIKNRACEGWRCLVGSLSGGYGLAGRMGPFLAYGLGEFHTEVGPPLDRGFRFAAGPTLGLWLSIGPHVRTTFEAEKHWRFWGDRTHREMLRNEWAWGFRHNWELRARGEAWRRFREGQLALIHYF